VLLLLACFSGNLFSQEPGNLEQLFKDPPVNTRPYVWWHWMGPNFSKEGITKDLEAMKAAGIGGATIFNLTSAVQESHAPTLNNPWPEQTYRSQAYWDALLHAASEAERLGLEIGLHNTVGYSTTGGPWIDEERSMQSLVWSDTTIDGQYSGRIVLKAPALVADEGWGATGRKLSFFREVAILAVPAGKKFVTREEVLDLTAYFHPDSGLWWSPEKGSWTIYRFCHASTGRPPHPVPDDLIGKTLEADKMSALQSKWHWEQVLEPLSEHLGKYIGRSFRHILIDSYEAGYQNWTPGFREEFIRHKGYDPLPWLITLGEAVTGMEEDTLPRRILENEVMTRRFAWDYADVIDQLFFENGFFTGKKMLDEKGLSLQFEPYGGPFCTARGVAMADLPMGEFWTYSSGSINPLIPSAARAAGKTVVGAEAFTGWPTNSMYTEDPAFLKRSADGCFASGVNRLVLHHWVHQPFDDRYQPGMGMGWWGTHFGRNQTWFEPGKAFFAYLGRCQALLQQGEQPGTYLCIDKPSGFSDVISAYDFMSMDITVESGKIRLPSGRLYPLLVFTDSLMLPAMAQKIKKLVEQGAVVAGPRPIRSPGLHDYPACDSVVSAIADELWKHGRKTGLSGGIVFDSLSKALNYLGQKTGALYEPASVPAEVAVVHRKLADSDIFFLVNRDHEALYFTALFPVSGKQPELWQAEDGSIMNAPVWESIEGRTRVELFLKGGQSLFVVFRKASDSIDHAITVSTEDMILDWNPIINSNGNMAFWTTQPLHGQILFESGKTRRFDFPLPETDMLEGPWQVAFVPKTGDPFQLEFPSLVDFSLHTNEMVRYFAGTATYRMEIRIEMNNPEHSNRFILDLGIMNDIAEIFINGKSAGVLWYPPYRADITHLLVPGKNTLEIAVTTNWANRMIGDEQEPADFSWGKDRGPDFGKALESYPGWFIKGEPRPSQGRVTFTNWFYYRSDSNLHPAGLSGPVRIIKAGLVEISLE
jgi:hypothetical protein